MGAVASTSAGENRCVPHIAVGEMERCSISGPSTGSSRGRRTNRWTSRRLLPLFLAALFVDGSASAAQESGILGNTAPQSDRWEFTAAPYVWMFGMDGDVRIRNTTAEFDVDFDDILDNLDFAAMVQMEARKGPFGLFVDPTYGTISVDGKSDIVDVSVDTELFIVDFGARYRVMDQRTESGRARIADISLGGRYFYSSNELDFEVLPDQKDSSDFFDLTVGARYAMDVTDRFGLLVGGDIGGFGIGSSSELSWSVQAMASWSFHSAGVVWAGYRVLDIDQDDGGQTGYDLQLSGPVLGYEFRF